MLRLVVTQRSEHLRGEAYPCPLCSEIITTGPGVGLVEGVRKVAAGGHGVIAHAGVVLPRLLADRVGLTAGLRHLVARRGFVPLRDRGRLLTDVVAAMIAGASCLRRCRGVDPAGGAVRAERRRLPHTCW